MHRWLVLIEWPSAGCYECEGTTGRDWRFVAAKDAATAMALVVVDLHIGCYDDNRTLTAIDQGKSMHRKAKVLTDGLLDCYPQCEVIAPPRPTRLPIDEQSLLGQTLLQYGRMMEDMIFCPATLTLDGVSSKGTVLMFERDNPPVRMSDLTDILSQNHADGIGSEQNVSDSRREVEAQ